MARSRSTDFPLTEDEATLLLDLAELSIRACLQGTRFPGPDVERLPDPLLAPCGAFVTLHVDGELNGCIGNIDADAPIGRCVGELAIKAAFEDPRLPKLRRTDLDRLHVEVSLLSARVSIPATGRDELLRHLRPDEHGLIISSGRRRGVFLPAVWEQIPSPDEFVDRLFHKATVRHDPWPGDLHAEVFTTLTVGRHLG